MASAAEQFAAAGAPGGWVRDVALERIPFAQQVELFQNTSVLVTTHGQGAANVAFVPPGGAMVLAVIRKKLDLNILHDCLRRSAMMIGMIFFLYIGATCFSYVFRVLGGDEVILTFVNESGLSSWGVLVLSLIHI